MGWLPEGLAAALAEFRKLTEPHPWAHAVWLMPTVLLGAWLVGKFFEWVGALEEAQLAVHRQRAAEAFAKQEALKRHGGGGAPSDAAVPSELAGKKQQ